MIRIALPLSLAALALLAACGTTPPGNTIGAAAPVDTQQLAYQPGSGVVQSVTPVPTASAGSTTPARAAPSPATTTTPGATTAPQRLAVRMDNGRVQYVDVTGPEIPRPGERVQLTADHMILKQ